MKSFEHYSAIVSAIGGARIEDYTDIKIHVPSEWRSEWPCSRLAGEVINVTINNVGEVVDFWFADGPFYPSGEDLEGAELSAVLGKFTPESVKRHVNLITEESE